jgi:hypothetical protein
MRNLSLPGQESPRPYAGGLPGHVERHVRWADRTSKHRRRERRFRERQHRKRMYVLTPAALAGVLLLAIEITAKNPLWPLVLIGIFLVVPLFTELSTGGTKWTNTDR